MKLGKFVKQPAEREAYAIDYTEDLTDGDTIASAVVLVQAQGAAIDATPLVIDPVQLAPYRVTMWAADGTDSITYKVTVTVTTVSGRILQDEVIIKIKDI